MPPSGSRVNCRDIETTSLWIFLLSTIQFKDQSWRNLCKSGRLWWLTIFWSCTSLVLLWFSSSCQILPPFILLTTWFHFLKAWTSDRADWTRWHCCHPYFYFLAFHLTLRIYLWKSVAMTTLSGWWSGSIQYVWQAVQSCASAHRGRRAVRQLSLLIRLITTRGGWTGMNKLTTDGVWVLLIKSKNI